MKLRYVVAALCVAGLATTSAFAADTGANAPAPSASAGNYVRFYTPLSWQMMNNYNGVGKEMFILNARQDNEISTGALYLGAYAEAAAKWTHYNSDGNWANATNLTVHRVDLSTLVAINSWSTGYVQLRKNWEDTVEVQDAYILLGDLTQSPIYGYVGKNDINFGSFESVNQYADILTREVFQASGTGAAVGMNYNGLNAVLSVMNGGSDEGMHTPHYNHINNFAANFDFGMKTGAAAWKVGAGYLNGGTFGTSGEYSGDRNAEWDVNGKVSLGNFDVLGEYVQTAKAVTGTIYEVGTESVIVADKKISGWNFGGAYNFPVMGRASVASLSYSSLFASSDQNIYNIVAGLRNQTFDNVWIGLEYAYTYGKTGVVITSNTSSNVTYKAHQLVLDVTGVF